MEQNSMQQAPIAETYPIVLTVPYPENSSRLLALCSLLFVIPKILILIPHYILLWVLGIAVGIAWVLSQLVVLFTGKYPRSFFDFIVGVVRWQIRMNAFLLGLTDQYPPFSLE